MTYIVLDHDRPDFMPRLVGERYYMAAERAVFNIMQTACPEYAGGRWEFATIHRNTVGKGGGYLYPLAAKSYQMKSQNGWEGEMSAEAAGICVTMTMLSSLSFHAHQQGNLKDCDIVSQHFHSLRQWSYDHAEAAAIVAFCD